MECLFVTHPRSLSLFVFVHEHRRSLNELVVFLMMLNWRVIALRLLNTIGDADRRMSGPVAVHSQGTMQRVCELKF